VIFPLVIWARFPVCAGLRVLTTRTPSCFFSARGLSANVCTESSGKYSKIEGLMGCGN
jgi:hypothetical protein